MKVVASIIKLSSLSLATLTLRTPVKQPVAEAIRNRPVPAVGLKVGPNAVEVILPIPQISRSQTFQEPPAPDTKSGSKKYYSNLNQPAEKDNSREMIHELDGDDDVNKRASDYIRRIRQKMNRNGSNN
ncbi:hypothetical protein ACOSP7_018193 [Xanthoceras sorbifolium]